MQVVFLSTILSLVCTAC